MARVGLDGLLEAVGGRQVGLCTSPSGWIGREGHLIDIFHARGQLAALFAPEHGVWGDLQAGDHVPDSRDARTGVPVHSLYGQARKPSAAMLDGVEVFVGCLQDAGARPYTFQATLAACLEACAAAGLPFVLLDRPTPLGGTICQGNVGEPNESWFPLAIPMRQALTTGELLTLLIAERQLDVAFESVPLLEAPRELWFDELPLHWVAPSPNLPTAKSCLLFAATVVLEGTNASEGRGTTRPFELLGAPWVDQHQLADELNRRELPGLLARPAAFVPTFSKHAGEVCRGVQLHVTDRLAFDPPRVGLHVLDVLLRLYPETFEIRRRGLDVRYDTPTVREALQAGVDPEAIVRGWEPERAAFQARAAARGVGPAWWGEG